MDFIKQGSGAVGDGHGEASDGNDEATQNRNRQREYDRRSSFQKQYLEEYFKKTPHPDVGQRLRLGEHLGLDQNQIKFWFQNKRTQTKKDKERNQNNALQQENQELLLVNNALKLQLKNTWCLDCNGTNPSGGQTMQMLRIENEELKKERDFMHSIMTGRRDMGHNSQASAEQSSLDQRMQEIAWNTLPQYQFNESEKRTLIDQSLKARNELFDLLILDEPMWVKSQLGMGVLLNQNTYENTYGKISHSKKTSIRRESSKDKGCVAMSTVELINKFMDVDTWIEVFPDFVTKAEIVCKIESTRCSIYVIHEKIHTLSPLVTPRECVFMRHYHQLDGKTWMMVDISYGHFNRYPEPLSSLTWKLPSGCLIKDLSNGFSEVTWVEHVEVDDRYITHPIFFNLIVGCQAYGARRWISSLQRACERFQALTVPTNFPSTDANYEWELGSKTRVLKVSERMMKSFTTTALSTEDESDVPYFFDLLNGKIRASFYKSFGLGQPVGLILRFAASFVLPIPCETVFYTIKDTARRSQWDMLSYGGSLREIAHITTGNQFGNGITIFQPQGDASHDMVIFQESKFDTLGGMMVYAPITRETLQQAMHVGDGTNVAILPSGFVVSGDGSNDLLFPSEASDSRAPPKNGSILTVAFQFLFSEDTSQEVDEECFERTKNVFYNSINNIKAVLSCS